MTTTPIVHGVPADDAKDYACATCTQRKVKCNRRQPCLACVKSRLPCYYRATPPPQRRKRKLETANEALLDRLRSHETTLRNAGLAFEAFDESNDPSAEQRDESPVEPASEPRPRSVPLAPIEDSTPAAPVPPSLPHRGILVPEHGGLRYYEHGLIGAMGREFKQGPLSFANQHPLGDTIEFESRHEASDMLRSSVLTGSPSAPSMGRSSHPPPAAVMRYWSIFLDNVLPLTKIVHAASTQQVILSSGQDTGSKDDALRFSIYACAVASLPFDECQNIFGRTKISLLEEFQSATRNALSEASFLKVPDIDLLRAHVLFLTSMFHTGDPSSLWILLGSAIRMAQIQGLHRDGAALGLSPFESEMRRRLWWYIVTLDERLTEMVGSDSSLFRSTDTALPSNLNDADLFPEMTSLPPPHIGASEMSFCLVKYEIARFMRENDPRLDRFELVSYSRPGKAVEKRDVSELESLLEERFLRFCDPVVPIQFLTSTMARSIICKLRQMEHRRKFRPSPEDERTTTLEQTKMTLSIAARNIEYDNLIHNLKSLRKFLWHVHIYFPWGAPIVILKVLSSYAAWDADMFAAWHHILELHEHHPEFREDDKVLHLIICGLTLKAWAAHVAGTAAEGMPKPQIPVVLQALQARHTAYMSRSNVTRNNGIATTLTEDIDFGALDGIDIFDLTDITYEGADWLSWGNY
ncbi:hypothetical protein LTR10_019338 [Elasticomyces elasticus]|uniref:Zn(2)-C6 fungal-type domain-containing protein n=1 Tax=Exophiala sideris TaxID=1016849 RepID=A0ABR0J1H8_9EURO|nr:hypothetical protein LTR10_019338 [Elasticomyces elasticus]KAK5024339.1 hypothetical protein LTS07_008630 [Exophiala sideris]KAK5030979.1 hypothetical protein LTR13_007992 [Exophiala sideris]KAK5054072.1 hypothetical protein LTR69_009034 [Exophiala sideris]KAK5179572.1 hypothetical protein LTR44_008088 [Eurotiomycetes sp. CCFEE 6388]